MLNIRYSYVRVRTRTYRYTLLFTVSDRPAAAVGPIIMAAATDRTGAGPTVKPLFAHCTLRGLRTPFRR